MPFDDKTRKRLQQFVSDARALLTDEFTRQLQHEYGLDPASGEVTELARLGHLDDTRRETARLLRDTLEHYLAASASAKPGEALDRIVREQAFTVLNRVCALRMAEAREIVIESIAKGYESKGFQLYARLAGTSLGETGDAYREYLHGLFDEVAVDLPGLFDRFSVQGRLFPRESALLGLFREINHTDLESLWAEDETIGWIYQYFNTIEERRQMRAESQAPRNSRELAVRNQFFTPRYVVEFLTDNTLGRIWYEMRKGETRLKEQCRYMVRRPKEIFLADGESESSASEGRRPPVEVPTTDAANTQASANATAELSQEQVLKHSVCIPHRPKKDPRELKILDPACGSGHFLLYCFDLLLTIYEEAYDDPDLGPALKEDYSRMGDLKTAVPRLIIEHNLHGVDIDLRASQIAALALWLRCQRAYLEMGQGKDRPKITRSNFVCAEPMPGEAHMLKEFVGQLEPKLLGQLVSVVFEKMKLAGEAGSLLKIEEDLRDAVAEAKKQWLAETEKAFDRKGRALLFSQAEMDRFAKNAQRPLPFDTAGIPDARFFEKAEANVVDSLRNYAERATNRQHIQRRLFTDDAVRGFAFVDVCRERFDVVLMNPPFGEFSSSTAQFARETFPSTKNDIYGAFLECARARLNPRSFIGAITPRTWLTLTRFEELRGVVSSTLSMPLCVDLGYGVLESMAEVAAFTLVTSRSSTPSLFSNLFASDDKHASLVQAIDCVLAGTLGRFSARYLADFRHLPTSIFGYDMPPTVLDAFRNEKALEASTGFLVKQGMATDDNERFLRMYSEVPLKQKPMAWRTYAKGGDFSMFWSDLPLVIDWRENGREIKERADAEYGSETRTVKNQDTFFRDGLTFSLVSQAGFSVRILPAGCIYDMGGPGIFSGTPNNHWTPLALLAFLNSTIVQHILKFITDSRHWHVITIQSIPVPKLSAEAEGSLAKLARSVIMLATTISRANEGTRLFICPFMSSPSRMSLREIAAEHGSFADSVRYELTEAITGIDQISTSIYPIDPDGLNSLRCERIERGSNALLSSPVFKLIGLAQSVLSWSVGVVFGAWDVRKAVVSDRIAECDEFLSLPDFPPGTLCEETVTPASDAPQQYPLCIDWDGILVDDAEHTDDLVTRVRKVVEFIWNDRADTIEQEASNVLGVKELRDYFRKWGKGGFWEDHLSRYSKSRRQAPIYWPLSTAGGEYTLWLYYHRLSDQTLYSCVNDFVEPKFSGVGEQAKRLRQKTGRSRDDDVALERLTDLEQELRAFRDELLRLAKFWKPNLNDGVQITAAPLWQLFQHKPWRKKLKQTWEELEAGEYDWAHLAYSIWPDRVREKCRLDKSLAIAHGLEALYEEPATPTKRRTSRRKKAEEAEEVLDAD